MGQMWGTKETSMTSNLQVSSLHEKKTKKNSKKKITLIHASQKFKRISESHAQIIIRPPVTGGTEGTTKMGWRKYEAFSY